MFAKILTNDLKNKIIDLKTLSSNFGIKIKEYNDRIILNYDMTSEACHKNKFHPYIRACRNLILNNQFDILHLSFDRFYNYGESDIDKIDTLDKCIIDEKLDGSLIGAYYDGNKWCWCTRSQAFAEGSIDTSLENINTFYDLLLTNVKPVMDKVESNGNLRFSYIFEFCSKYNRIITRYSKPRLVLLAVRDKINGEYIDREFEGIRIGLDDYPKVYHLSNIEQVIEMSKHLPSLEEGFVVYDEVTGIRVKIKNPQYLLIHHTRFNGGLTFNRVIHLVHNHEEDEYLTYFPEDKEEITKYIWYREKIKEKILNDYEQIKGINKQKDYALTIKDNPYKSILFLLRSGKDYDKILANMNESSVEKMYEIAKEIF